MIKISDKKKCCGCSACAQICPRHCISMFEDEEGFLYPHIDLNSCTDCGFCENVCPVLNQSSPHKPIQCYAVKGKITEIVRNSSSAGVFSLLAEQTILKKGVVFGARFDHCWDVIHSFSDTIEGLSHYRDSKYVQSRIGNCYQLVESFLKDGREVLFSGTPCQIAGLKHYLGEEYNNLTTVDVVCHGVPSPVVWRSYLRKIIGKKPVSGPLDSEEASFFSSISFRDKSYSWNQYCVRIDGKDRVGRDKTLVLEKYYYNIFTRAFLNNYILRPSCYDCPAKEGRSCSDILLGDFWGIRNYYPDFFSPNGVSMVLAYSERGSNLVNTLDLDQLIISYEETKGNKRIETSVSEPIDRDVFFQSFRQKGIKALNYYNNKVEKHSVLLLIGKNLNMFRRLFK